MALFQVDIEKFHQGEYWSNRYIVDADTLLDAHAIGNDIVEIEQTIHKTVVLFTKYRTSDRIVGTDAYFTTNVNQFGLAPNIIQYLPLFNVVRVDFTTVGGGRPSRKYLRLPLDEVDQNSGQLDAGFVSFINTNYAQLMQQLQGFVDVDGQPIQSASVHPFVGMRQLRRGSKRKALPIIP